MGDAGERAVAHAIVQATPASSRVLVTGANGFIGSALCRALVEAGHAPQGAVRRIVPSSKGLDTATCVGEIDGNTDWSAALGGIECIVHLAARTHMLRETAADLLAEYRRVNVEGTQRLAQQATAAGVRRFVFLSSVKVNGEMTAARAFTENDAPRPEDVYGISKWEAEQELLRISRATGLEIVVLRPPLVYGPGVKGNFLRLLRLVARGVPLPLASVHNRRSLVYLGNLVDAIVTAISAPQAAGQTYLVSDGQDVSTPDLVRAIARALDVRARLFPCPVALLRAAAALAGRGEEAARLTGSLQVDVSKIGRELGWQPRYTLEQGLAETARWFKSRES